MKYFLQPTTFIMIILFFVACHSGEQQQAEAIMQDTASAPCEAMTKTCSSDSTMHSTSSTAACDNKKEVLPIVFIYNFHVTNRCASCIAIEEATTKTINTYFSKEVKEGRIKRKILNVDDEANKKISEKYEAFGSGLFITRAFKGKETTTDMTGDGFKYAKNKEDKFIELLKNRITEYLK